MELILGGGHGNISVTANVAPQMMAQLCEYALAQDRSAAEAVNAQLTELNRVLFLEANPIPVKWALHHQGLIGEGIRLPMTVLDERYQPEVVAALKALGL